MSKHYLVNVGKDGEIDVCLVTGVAVHESNRVALAPADRAVLMRAAYETRAAGPGEFFADNVGTNRIGQSKNKAKNAWDVRRTITVTDSGDAVHSQPTWCVRWNISTPHTKNTFGWAHLPHTSKPACLKLLEDVRKGEAVSFTLDNKLYLEIGDGAAKIKTSTQEYWFPPGAARTIATDVARMSLWPEPSGGYSDFAPIPANTAT